nr:hypothetical protein [Aeromicrobium flavum]
MTVHGPYAVGVQGVRRRVCSGSRPAPVPTWSVEVPPTSRAPVRRATSGESITWSKWLCTGSTASTRGAVGPSSPSRSSPASIRSGTGAIRPTPTFSSDGREKNPSTTRAEAPSSNESVDTPAKVTPGRPSAASGTSNRLAYGVRSGRPSFMRMQAP